MSGPAPRQNGLLTGNRGCLHDARGSLGRARRRGRRRISCKTTFRGRRRTPMAPGRHIELFFLDEAVALAASHRPCAEFLLARAGAGLPGNGAEAIECHLRAPHITTDGAQARHDATIAGLPDGTLLAGTTAPRAGRGQHLLPFTPAGYGPPRAPHPDGWRPSPPPPVVAVPAAGYRPLVHPGAT